MGEPADAVLAYDLDEGSGSSAANSGSAGSDWDLTLSSVSWITGPNTNAIDADAISCATSTGVGGPEDGSDVWSGSARDLTVSFLTRFDTNSQYSLLWELGEVSNGGENTAYVLLDYDSIYFVLDNSGTTIEASGDFASYVDSDFHRVTVTVDGGATGSQVLRILIDGTEVGTNTASFSWAAQSVFDGFQIASAGGAIPFEGDIAAIRLYDRVLSSGEEAELFTPASTAAEVAPDSAAQAMSSTLPTVSQQTDVDFDDTAHGHSASEPALDALQPVSVSDAAHAQSADEVVSEGIPLASPQNASQGHSVASVQVDAEGQVTVGGSALGHTASEPVMTAVQPVTVLDAAMAISSDIVVMTVPPTVEPDNTTHEHFGQSPDVSDDTIRFTPPRAPVDRTITSKNYRNKRMAAFAGLWMKLEAPSHGQNVWRDSEGGWHTGAGTMAELQSAEVVYLGGRTYVITEALAAELETAGYDVDRPVA